MLAKDMLTSHLPVAHLNDTPEEVVQMMSQAGISETVLLDVDLPNGLIHIEEIERLANSQLSFDDLDLDYLPQKTLRDNQHHLQILHDFSQVPHAVLPVVDADGEYLGLIERKAAFQAAAHWLTVARRGAIITLEIKWLNYSLQEIAGIVEGTGVKILGMYMEPIVERELLLLTLKLSEEIIPSVIAALERYDYTIQSIYTRQKADSEAKTHYKALMRYLEI